jgi:hypothetical protein
VRKRPSSSTTIHSRSPAPCATRAGHGDVGALHVQAPATLDRVHVKRSDARGAHDAPAAVATSGRLRSRPEPSSGCRRAFARWTP